MTEQERPMAGRAVEGAGNVAEKAITQVEGAVVAGSEITEDQAARLLGYLRAGRKIVQSALQNGLDLGGDVLEDLEKELDDFNRESHEALREGMGEG